MNENHYRFRGTQGIYGEEGFNRLQHSHIAVIGIGGVGSWVAEYLARTGIGKLTLVDLDDICHSNINRQIHALSSTAGQLKTAVMKQRIEQINPNCEVVCIERLYSEKSSEEILSENYDYVVDAFDDAKSKAYLVKACLDKKIPLLVTGGAASKVKPELVQLKDLAHSFNDPLLFRVRKELLSKYKVMRTYKNGRQKKKIGIPCVFSPEKMLEPKSCGTTTYSSSKMNCQSGYGSVSFVTAHFASLACAHIINELMDEYVY